MSGGLSVDPAFDLPLSEHSEALVEPEVFKINTETVTVRTFFNELKQ